jgi:DNA-binding response OmpR family regulator
MQHGVDTASDAPVEQRAYSPRILLAEDDEDFRMLLVKMLDGEGYRVIGLATGSDLLVAIQAALRGEEAPALLIADERMPGMTGLSVFEQARAWGVTLPFILITSFGDEEIIQRAKRIGVTVMTKPFAMDELRTLVGWLVPRRVA